MNEIKFKDLGLSKNVLKAIDTLGFKEPSKIQNEIIPLILEGYDVVGQAQTGTGKTLAFAASILSKISKEKGIKAIILTPTRELALQVSEEFSGLNVDEKTSILSVYGGSSIELQIRALRKGVDIIVGTPGRIMDLMNRKILSLNNIEYFVLDEADEMLNMGFGEDIDYIYKNIEKDKQVLLFSATMPKSILDIASKYMKEDYQNISIIEESNTSINVSQYYYLVNPRMREEALCRVMDVKNPGLAIIFCQRKSDVDSLLTEMTSRNYNVEAMHGDIAQNMRIQTLERFKQGMFTYLIATDVAARGIHVNNIDLVVNYNLPQDVESYIHRIGRTGRAGNTGEAISFVTPREERFLQDVEKHAKCKIIKCELPTEEEVYKSKYKKVTNEIKSIADKKEYEECVQYVRDMNKDELIKFSASALKIMLSKEIGSNFKQEIIIKKDRRETVSKNMTRVFLTIGKMDNIKKGSLLDFMKIETKIDKDNFQNIEILTKFTFMDISTKVVDDFIKKMYNKKMNNRTIRVEKAKSK